MDNNVNKTARLFISTLETCGFLDMEMEKVDELTEILSDLIKEEKDSAVRTYIFIESLKKLKA